MNGMTMKSILLYFSQSGNTKKMARAMADGIRAAAGHCDLVPLAKVEGEWLGSYDLIGVGTPCWSGVPFHVERQIREMAPMPGKHAFTFCTHGTLGYRFMPNMVRLLEEKGMVVIGWRDWYAAVFHPYIPKPYLTDGHPDAIDLEEASGFGRLMVETSRRVFAGERDLIPPASPLPPPRTLSRPSSPKRIDMEKCRYPECHLCVDHCRLKIIDLSVSPPVFPEECPPCFFCELICPTGAIEADYEEGARLEGERARTMFLPALDRAEAEGRFRRLVAVDEVGWDTPFYLAHKTHPRYVIPEEDL